MRTTRFHVFRELPLSRDLLCCENYEADISMQRGDKFRRPRAFLPSPYLICYSHRSSSGDDHSRLSFFLLLHADKHSDGFALRTPPAEAFLLLMRVLPLYPAHSRQTFNDVEALFDRPFQRGPAIFCIFSGS